MVSAAVLANQSAQPAGRPRLVQHTLLVTQRLRDHGRIPPTQDGVELSDHAGYWVDF